MELRDREKAVVIGDGANYDDCLVGVGRVVGTGASNVDDT